MFSTPELKRSPVHAWGSRSVPRAEQTAGRGWADGSTTLPDARTHACVIPGRSGVSRRPCGRGSRVGCPT